MKPEKRLGAFFEVTGHGTYAPAMHMQSLERLPSTQFLCPIISS